MTRAPYQVSFLNFSNVIHDIQKFKKQCQIKWTKKNKGNKVNKKKKGMMSTIIESSQIISPSCCMHRDYYHKKFKVTT